MPPSYIRSEAAVHPESRNGLSFSPKPLARRTSALLGLCVASTLSMAALAADEPKADRKINGNMTVDYLVLPGEASSVNEMFSGGEFYGRLRSNTFAWDWETEAGNNQDHEIGGIGGSLIWKSGRYNGFGLNFGVYATSNAYFRVDEADYATIRAGKDLISRGTGDGSFALIGEAAVNYQGEKLGFVVGRQLYESHFTASNDTKMIPNTFDGASFTYKAAAGIKLAGAWFYQTKLRDHIYGHDFLTYNDDQGRPWRNQDDSGAHRGLTFDRLTAAGLDTDNEMIILSAQKKFGAIDTKLSHLRIPELMGQTVLEFKGGFNKGGAFSIHPALKIMMQHDEEGGRIGGASLRRNVSNDNPRGYTDPDSLESTLVAARVEFRQKSTGFAYRIGYSQVSDDADIVAPWRGFPTGGYTRPMGQVNWTANESSWMFQVKGNLSKWLPWDGTRFLVRHGIFDRDESKGFTDRSAFNVDIDQQLTTNLSMRLRTVLVSDDGNSDYNEYRMEFNYLL
ncbi:MAG: hypothetical protein V2I45_03600 [Halieaceae bacterium]|jgi:hypothetical protein|nr:hypothetical protein [Halieaceae bacterium]